MARPVLIIETNALCLSAMSFLVLSAGFQPMAYDTARAACAALEQIEGEPAAIITEFDLGSSCESHCIIDSLRRRYPAMPIIVLTADTSAAARGALEGLDCHVLFKPSRPDEILALLPTADAEPHRGRA